MTKRLVKFLTLSMRSLAWAVVLPPHETPKWKSPGGFWLLFVLSEGSSCWAVITEATMMTATRRKAKSRLNKKPPKRKYSTNKGDGGDRNRFSRA